MGSYSSSFHMLSLVVPVSVQPTMRSEKDLSLPGTLTMYSKNKVLNKFVKQVRHIRTTNSVFHSQENRMLFPVLQTAGELES